MLFWVQYLVYFFFNYFYGLQRNTFIKQFANVGFLRADDMTTFIRQKNATRYHGVAVLV